MNWERRKGQASITCLKAQIRPRNTTNTRQGFYLIDSEIRCIEFRYNLYHGLLISGNPYFTTLENAVISNIKVVVVQTCIAGTVEP